MTNYDLRAKDDRLHRTIERITAPETSHVFGAEYNLETGLLTITFKPKGTKPATSCDYAGYPKEEWEKFKVTDSFGKFINSQIIGRFKGVERK